MTTILIRGDSVLHVYVIQQAKYARILGTTSTLQGDTSHSFTLFHLISGRCQRVPAAAAAVLSGLSAAAGMAKMTGIVADSKRLPL